MDCDEKDICQYLKGLPQTFISQREIAQRAAGERRFRENPNWAATVLARMVEKGILESDSTGYFRLKGCPEPEKPRRWISPHIQSLLEKAGKTFEIPQDVEEEAKAQGSDPPSMPRAQGSVCDECRK